MGCILHTGERPHPPIPPLQEEVACVYSAHFGMEHSDRHTVGVQCIFVDGINQSNNWLITKTKRFPAKFIKYHFWGMCQKMIPVKKIKWPVLFWGVVGKDLFP